MKYCVGLLVVLCLGCSRSGASLEQAFGTDKPGSNSGIPIKEVTVTGHTKGDFAVFRAGSEVDLTAKEVRVNLLGLKPLAIPSSEVYGCTVVCFGGEKWDIDLLIPKTGTSISFEHSKEIYEWCWNNKLPMVSGDATRKWLYSNKPLPNKASFKDVLASRSAYDKQARLACNGY